MLTKESLYRSLVDLIPDAIVVLQDGLYVMVNPAFRKILGYTQEDVDQGLGLRDLVPEQDRESALQRYEACLAGEQLSRTFRINLVAQNGDLIPCETTATAIQHNGRPAVLAVMRDIAEYLNVEEALRRSESMHRGLIDNMLEGAYLTKPDGTILKANAALVHMLGYESEKELCETVHAAELYVNPDDRQILVRKLEEDGELRNVEFRLRCKDGKEIIVLENSRAIRGESEETTHYEGLLANITDRI